MSVLQYEEIKFLQYVIILKLEQNLYILVIDYQVSGVCYEGVFEWGLFGDVFYCKLLIEEQFRWCDLSCDGKVVGKKISYER